MLRYVFFIFMIALGVILGLFYGREVNPVELVEVPPDSLRVDYKTDYVLMVAEVYAVEQDPVLAARQLALLDSAPPQEIITQALSFAMEASYTLDDLALMNNLSLAMRTWSPALESGD